MVGLPSGEGMGRSSDDGPWQPVVGTDETLTCDGENHDDNS